MTTLLRSKTIFIAGTTGPLVPALVSRLVAEGAAVRSPPDGRREADALASLSAEAGSVDVLLNVIPSSPAAAFFDMAQSDWDRVLSETLSDAFRWSQAIGRAMSLSGNQGTIVNIVCESHRSQGEFPVFAPMIRRGCTIAFTQALAAELADRQIQVNAIVARTAEQEESAMRASEDVIRATLFLCAAHGTSVTGETIYVGGAARAYESAHFPA